MKTSILGPAYTARSKNLAADRCINLFTESAPPGPGKEPGALFGCPGLVTELTLPTMPVYGVIPANNKVYAVGGSRLYEVDAAMNSTDLGYVGATGRVSMAENGLEVVINTGYRYVFATSTLSQITDADFPMGQLRFQDGYFLGNEPNTGRIQISELYDGSSWNSLDYTTAEGLPDNVTAHISVNRQWWAMGPLSMEIYENLSSGADFPFLRIGGGFVSTGIEAPESLCKFDNTIVWIGRDDTGKGIVFRANGYNPQRISTHAVEFAMSQMSDISDAFGFVYQMEGHANYVLNFPTGNQTWTYDGSTGLWHERAWRQASDNSLHRIRANCYCFAFGKHLIGDHTNGKIYSLDLDTYTDAGDARKWLRSFHLPNAEGNRIRVNSLQINMEVGVGLDGSGQGTDPKIMLRVSKDGGQTWGNEKQLSIGRIGQYSARVKAWRLGIARDFVFEISGTDPVKIAITGAYVDAEALRS